MNEPKYAVAIEISSSKIMAVIGHAHSDGQLDIVAAEQKKGIESVRHGIIKNLEETSARIKQIINILERRPNIAPRKITGLYVGLSGCSMRSIPTQAKITLPEETEITEEIIQRLLKQAYDTDIDSSLEIVDAVPRIYKVDRIETISPKGNVGNSISAGYDLIVCRPELKRMLSRCIEDKIHIPIHGILVTALAAGQLILSSEEKRLGCMLVNIGAETTCVTIYKNGHLVYYATLPLGGRNITRDITSLNLLEERAEDLKITSGNAIPRETTSTLNYNGIREVDISNLVVARAEEIVVNIMKQINYAELNDSDLPGGIVCIGGGSRLHGMLDLIANKTGLPVRRGSLPSYIHINDPKVNANDIIDVASVLYAGAMAKMVDCMSIPEEEIPLKPEPEPEPGPEYIPRQKNGWWNRIKDNIGKKVSGMYVSPEDDSDLLE